MRGAISWGNRGSVSGLSAAKGRRLLSCFPAFGRLDSCLWNMLLLPWNRFQRPWDEGQADPHGHRGRADGWCFRTLSRARRTVRVATPTGSHILRPVYTGAKKKPARGYRRAWYVRLLEFRPQNPRLEDAGFWVRSIFGRDIYVAFVDHAPHNERLLSPSF